MLRDLDDGDEGGGRGWGSPDGEKEAEEKGTLLVAK